jgi:hypothetical protein
VFFSIACLAPTVFCVYLLYRFRELETLADQRQAYFRERINAITKRVLDLECAVECIENRKPTYEQQAVNEWMAAESKTIIPGSYMQGGYCAISLEELNDSASVLEIGEKKIGGGVFKESSEQKPVSEWRQKEYYEFCLEDLNACASVSELEVCVMPRERMQKHNDRND